MSKRSIPGYKTTDSGSVVKAQDDEPKVTLPPPTSLVNLGNSFPKQFSFTEDKSTFIVAQCSRRAGKSTGLALRFLKTMEKHPKCTCIYLALTLESALEIMMPVFQELNDKYHLGLIFTKKTITHRNGSILRIYGADMKNFIKRLKGKKYAGVGVDEAQDFGSHLQSLIDDVLTPSIADYTDGWLALTGTPGPIPVGYFFEVTQLKKYGYAFHAWTLFDNPHMPNPRGFVDLLKKRREWKDDNPSLRREYLNEWVLDMESLWVRYNKTKSNFEKLPDNVQWHYILGIDIGFKDADALAVLAWHENSPVTYLIEEEVTPKNDITNLVDLINGLRAKYDFDKMVMDEGALGKKIAEEIRRRHKIPVQAADKARKQENVELLNDAMRLGNFKAREDSRFVRDSYMIQIDWDKSTSNRYVIKKTYHSDIIDSVLYAFKESPAFSYEAPIPKPKKGTSAWAEAEEKRMYEEALDHFESLAQNKDEYGDY